jgi:DNA-binding NtrC family response regulator
MGTMGRKMTVLLIDQDIQFRSSTSAMLREEGYVVQEHAQSSDVAPLGGMGEVGLVITDHTADKQDGLAFADAFHQAHPSTPIVLLTAYWSLYLAGEAARRSYIHLRRKPIGHGELCSLVRHLGNQPPVPRLDPAEGESRTGALLQ